MSTTLNEMTTEAATTADSGATVHFITDKSPYDAVRDIPKERVDELAREVLDAEKG